MKESSMMKKVAAMGLEQLPVGYDIVEDSVYIFYELLARINVC